MTNVNTSIFIGVLFFSSLFGFVWAATYPKSIPYEWPTTWPARWIRHTKELSVKVYSWAFGTLGPVGYLSTSVREVYREVIPKRTSKELTVEEQKGSVSLADE